MSNHITIELCAEDRQRIDELIGFAGWIVSEMKSNHGLKVVAPAEEHPVDAIAPHDDPEPEAVPAEKVYKVTKEDIMAKVQALAAPNNPKREQAKAIVKSYGAKVSDIPEDKYAEVMDQLTKLDKEG